eukprot:CAMPEP_0178442390 /NCGR_PEP_ID=MMETSP0689_2-20121128/38121_1 /TAXON_ID=160604 /ORGANISM="Amphidinium massartii, Strain CS-259" /LENGTH=280 /DNA_ID=CAMNT_0020065897 /DNA_START=64 /DNA_END=906 /DNA_ORIENTATION=-
MAADGNARISELEADLKELNAMMVLAKRPGVVKELQRLLEKKEAELQKEKCSGKEPEVIDVPAPAPAPAPTPASAPSKAADAPRKEELAKPSHEPVPVQVKTAGPWTEITTFGLELGGYNSAELSVDVRLKGIEALPKEAISCDFTETSFDLKVSGLDGVNYRMLKNNLEKDIVPAESTFRVKKNHVIVTLKKVKGEYGYDSWTDLVAKGRRQKPMGKDSNPQDAIMGMMQDLYESGDDNMKKTIGEAMYKARRGESMDPSSMPKTDPLANLGGLDDEFE